MSSDICLFSWEIDIDIMCFCYYGFRLFICGFYDKFVLVFVIYDNDNVIIMYFFLKIR